MSRPIFFAILLLFTACADAAAAPGAGGECPEFPGVPDGKLLLLGEMHGSTEAPAFAGELACSLSKSEVVAVGLEILSSDQPAIDAYLASNGTSGDVEELIRTHFWQTVNDGRSSLAMLSLIERVRALAANGHPISVFAFDDQPGTELERDVAIANGIRRFQAANPNARIVALMGNIHAMQDPITFGGKELIPSGALLKDLKPDSILIAYPAGTVWACMPECGIQTLKPLKGAKSPSTIQEGSPLAGYKYTYLLPSISPSLRAVQ